MLLCCFCSFNHGFYSGSNPYWRASYVILLVDSSLLFGSRAKKSNSGNSDYDILIVTDQPISVEEKTPLRTNIRKDLLLKGIRSDILIQSKAEIEKKRMLPGHIIRRILNEAIIL